MNYEKKIIYGAYARKSSESEDRQVQSLDTQIDHILELQQNQNLILFDEPIREQASAFVPGREGFAQLVKLTKQGKINAWLCYNANRLSRNAYDAGVIITLLDDGLLDHIRTPTNIYRNTANDKMMLQFEFVFSKKSSDDKKGFIRDGLHQRYLKGYPNGKAPIGFINDITKEKGDRPWIVDKERFASVKMIFERFLLGNDSITTISNFARNELKLRTVPQKRMGGNLIARSGVERLLKNPIYAGFFYANVHHSQQREAFALHKDMPTIITRRQHNKILEMLEGRSHPKKQKHEALFSGYLKGQEGNFIGADHKYQIVCDCKYKFCYRDKEFCPKCNTKISKMKTPKYLSYTYYYNVKRSKSNKKTKYIEEKKIIQFILEYIRSSLAISDNLFLWSTRYLKKVYEKGKDNQEIKKASLNKEKKLINQKIGKLKDLYYNDAISVEEYKEENQKLKNEKESLMLIENDGTDDQEHKKCFSDLLEEFTKILENDDIHTKKQLLSRVGSNLVWDEEKLLFIKPKWLLEFENVRKHMIAKYEGFEPKNHLINKGDLVDFGVLCPTLLCQWDRVRNSFSKTIITKMSVIETQNPSPIFNYIIEVI